MSGFRIDDKSAFHRKVLRAGNEAWGALCRAAASHPGGTIPIKEALVIAPWRVWVRLAVAELVISPGGGVLEIAASDLHGWTGTRDYWDRSAYDEVYERDGNRCRYCGSDSNLSIDHVVPRSRGGSDAASNLVVACRPCNSSKGAHTPEEAGLVLQEHS